MRNFLVSLLIATSPLVGAQGATAASPDYQQRAQALDLGAHAVWRKLLHVQPGEQRSEILTAGFFLASPQATPADELSATLAAFFAALPDNQNEHAICRFPARYLWLDEQLDLSRYGPPQPDCSRLREWANFDNLNSLSLIQISGYFGNPASSFGHVLLRLNNSEHHDTLGLLQQGINFGALVPDGEPVFIYIVRGLLGGYQAGFSDQGFYTQDQTYSRTEFRDMWEYELDLEPRQVRLVAMHLWEIVGAKFTYYFLEKNCAYRIAELLELVSDTRYLPKYQRWYLPISIFHSAEAAHARGDMPIKQIRYLPSSQRLLYTRFERLDDDEQRIFNAFITAPESYDLSTLKQRSARSQADVGETLLAYYRYKLAGADSRSDSTQWDDQTRTLVRIKDRLLGLRLTLPARAGSGEPPRGYRQPPSNGSRPNRLRVGAGHSDAFGGYGDVSYSAVHYDLAGAGNAPNMEMRVADVGLRIDDDGINLERFDVISVQKIHADVIDIVGESRRSWRVRAGVKRKHLACRSCLTGVLRGGIGRAWRLHPNVVGYGFIEGMLESRDEHIGAQPSVGLIVDAGPRFKSNIELGYRYYPQSGRGDEQLRIETRWSLNTNNQIRLSARKDIDSEVALSLSHYW